MKAIVFLSFTFCCFICSAQVKETANKTIYAEVFGQGFNGSINFDYKFNFDKKFHNSYTAGIVFVPKAEQFGDGFYFGIPVSYNWFLGKKNHQLELGLGFTPLIVDKFNANYGNKIDALYTYLTPKIGYRFQQRDGGMFFKVTATPMIALFNFSYGRPEFFNNVVNIGNRAFPWPGASIGWTLK